MVSNQQRFPATKRVRGLVLVGRGAGAGQLARLRAGQKITADVSLSQDAAMAITGNTFILRDGVKISRGRPSTCTRAPPSGSTATPGSCC